MQSIKRFASEHQIIVFVDDADQPTIDWLLSESIEHIVNDEQPRGIAYGYNRCIDRADGEVVCMFHADMVMGPNFVQNMLKHYNEDRAVAATRIEPPLHPAGPEKLIEDFGVYPDQFKQQAFDDYVIQAQQTEQCKDKTTAGIFAPWLANTAMLRRLGMHDESFHSYHEDSDIFNRLVLRGVKPVQSRDAFVYHYTCRGGQFKDGVEQVTNDRAFHEMKQKAYEHYVKKWRCGIMHDELMYPQFAPKYNTQMVALDLTPQQMRFLEPWCDDLVTKPNGQPFSVIVTIDKTVENAKIVQLVTNLGWIVKQSNQLGEFEFSGIKVTVNNLIETQGQLMRCNNSTT